MDLLSKVRGAGRFGRKLGSLMRIVPAIVAVVCFVMLVVSIVCCTVIWRGRTDRKTAASWSGGGELSYRHMAGYAHGARALGEKSPASYLEYGRSLSKTDVYNIRKSLQNVVDISNGKRRRSGDVPVATEGFADCYSSFIEADVMSLRQQGSLGDDKSATASVYAVGGNFKACHLFEYMSGGFLPVQPVDKYQIVINDALAWRFYSSYDVVGEKISLWNKDYTIIGVVREHDGDTPRAYVYFECLEEYCAGLDASFTPAVLCYEAIMPEQVKNVAVADVRNSVPGYDQSNPGTYVVSVTGRYSIGSIWDYMMPPGSTSDLLRDYDLPYWEVSAGRAVASMFAWEIVAVVCAAMGVVMVTVIVVMRRKSGLKPGL